MTAARQAAQKRNWRLFKIAGASANLKIICDELNMKHTRHFVCIIEKSLHDETIKQYKPCK